MDKFILCLANSYKYGGRCIAGIEVSLQEGQLSINKSSYGIPIWIRPVSNSAAGEVPLSDAIGIKVLSVVKIVNACYAGSGSHSEDYYYAKLQLLDTLNPSDEFLKKYTDTWHNCIFGNKGRALTPDAFQNGDYSLMLIRTEGSEIYLDTRYTPKPRIKFNYNGNEYDFPITDPEYLNRLRLDDSLYRSEYGVLYIVASLGVIHDGWHSKLAATIIIPSVNNIKESIILSKQNQAPINNQPNPRIQNTSYRSVSVPRSTQQMPRQILISQAESRRKENLNTTNHTSKPIQNTSQNKATSGGCYIATTIYGSYDCPEVWTLRRFRDLKLAESVFGRAFIKLYYSTSPTLVKWFGKTLFFKKTFKPILDKLVYVLQHEGVESTPYKDIEW
ncbi:dual OB domain-containing protein [Leyella stercorea]|uniref:dual OB domain-containing protein n=1 Tax=Leyella stercorea TaxID=363265 RepID=UPI00242FFF56|nr:CFI-box-CTERM domain-containing protein [Leyella stercorea]